MKKTILFYSALLLTVAGTAQTTVHSQQKATGASQVQKQADAVTINGSGSASTATTVQTDAAAKTEAKAKAELVAKREAIVSKKEEMEATGKTTIEKVANKEVTAEASANSNSNVNAGENQAQINAKGSLNTGTTVSLSKVNDHAVEVKKEVATRIENKTNATLQKTAEVKTAAHTKVTGVANQTASAAAGTGTKVATKVKTTPAPVKVKTHLNTAAGIKLR